MLIAYHEIVPAHARYIYSVTCSSFEEHLDAAQNRNPVQVTFDDGHISQYLYALPLLEKYKVKAAFCITAGWTDRELNYMNRAQLRELLSLGHKIYAHGWSHRMLTRCSPSELRIELYWAKHALEDILGAAVEGVSIPHGRWNDRVLESCASCGYRDVYVSDPEVGPLHRAGIRLTGRLMMTRNISGRSLMKRVDSGSAFTRPERIRRMVTRSARFVLGDRRYRRVWKRLGNQEQELPSAADPKQEIAVLQLISSGGFYGAESMLIHLAAKLCENAVRPVVGVFRNSQNPNTEVADRAIQSGLQTEVIACKGRLDWRAVEAIRALAYKYGVDLIHTHGSKASFYGRLAGMGLRMPLVATYHNSFPGAGMRLRIYHVVDRLILRGFTRIVAVSESIKQSLRSSGISARKLVVIENGIDLDPFLNSVGKPFIGAGGPQRLSIGVVGRLIPLKGHRFLLEAARDIVRRFPNAHFVFVGDGPELPNLQRRVSALGLDAHVTFAGKQGDMPSVYRSLDILVMPSLHEGMPMTPIEALASRCAVIATTVGDIPKLIKHQETGILVEPGNSDALKEAVLTLLSDKGMRSALAARGQCLVRTHFSSVTMAARYREIYGRLSDPDRSHRERWEGADGDLSNENSLTI